LQPRSPFEKRHAALALLKWFDDALPSAKTSSTITKLVREARDRVEALQGTNADKPFFARTVCRLAHALRRAGCIPEAIALIEWAIQRGGEDAYVYTELIQCHVQRGELVCAERLLWVAEERGYARPALYSSLIAGYGRAGKLGHAKAIFTAAESQRLADAHVSTAMIHSYALAGDTESARRTLENAKARGAVNAGVYNAMIAAYLHNRQWAKARQLFEEAKRKTGVDGHTYRLLSRTR